MVLKAYAVQEEDEGTGGIVWAHHAVVARREGANQYDNEFESVSCRRAPWADGYHDKPLPASLMIANCWWFECCGCGEKLDEYWFEETGLPLDGVIGSQDSAVFCCQACKDRRIAREAGRKAVQDGMLDVLRQMVTKRFPGVKLITGDFKEHAWAQLSDGNWIVTQAVVSFVFPGMVHGPASLHLRYDRYGFVGPEHPVYYCCGGDQAAFEAYAKQAKRETV